MGFPILDGFPMDIIFILLSLLRVYEMCVFARIMLSWIQIDPDNKVIDFLIKITDPVLLPVREVYMRIMDRLNIQIPLDLSPIVVFLLIGFLERILASYL